MCKNSPQYISRILILIFTCMALVLSGCQLQLLPSTEGGESNDQVASVAQPVATEEPIEESEEAAEVEATEQPNEEPTEVPATSTPLIVPTATVAPPTATDVPPTATTVPPTTTAVPPTATAIPPTATTVPPTATLAPPTATTAPPTATLVPPTATQAVPLVSVTISSLRIRSGPGVEYNILGAASQGSTFVITGQAYNCQWYQIQHPEFGSAWLSGGAEYVTTTNANCAQVPAAAIPAAPPTAVPPPPTAVPPTAAPPPTAPPAPAPPTAVPPAAVPPTAVPPAPAATAAPAAGPPADQGCYLLQNQLGAELTVTFTNSRGQAVGTFKVAKSEEVPFCLYPDKYSVTIDAPPPWGELNDILNVKAGDSFYFPIRPAN